MSGGLLDFFVLEASEYTEQLDGALARAGGGPPEPDGFLRSARALRGSATMARVTGVAAVAASLERLARALRDGSLHWTEPLRAAVIAAVDDLKILVRGARAWGAAEDQRARSRAEELERLAPVTHRPSLVTPIGAAGGATFLSTETGDIGAALRHFAEAPGPLDRFADTVRRLRALRGVAALADLPPLKEVVDAVDEAIKTLELGASASEAHRALFRAAADVLREAGDAARAGRVPDPGTDAVAAFTAAASLLVARAEDPDYVVPISALFPEGGAANVVHASPNPPTTPVQRFRLEVVSQAEHLRRLVHDARAAADPTARQRVGHELRGAVRALSRAAESFGETTVARAVHGLVEAAASLEGGALDALDRVATTLGSAEDSPLADRVRAALAAPAIAAVPPAPPASRVATAAPARPPTPIAAAPVATAATARQSGSLATPAPSGTALREALDSGISELTRLEEEPLAEPAPVDEDDAVIPIQELLYRGRAALQRALEVRDAIRTSTSPPDAESLAELFELLELATTE
jgi:chemotaxis protein histidine kinase CheA